MIKRVACAAQCDQRGRCGWMVMICLSLNAGNDKSASLRAQFRLDPDGCAARCLWWVLAWGGQLGGRKSAGELVLVALPAVQDFIAEAQPTSDVYASSDSYAALADQVMRALRGAISSRQSAAQPCDGQFLGRVG
jgi:hypothetical protein